MSDPSPEEPPVAAKELAAELLAPLTGVDDELRLSLQHELEQRIAKAPQKPGEATPQEALAQVRKSRAAVKAPGRIWKIIALLSGLALLIVLAFSLFLPGLHVLLISIGKNYPWESSFDERPLQALLRPDSRWQPQHLSAPGNTDVTWPWDESDPMLYFSASLGKKGPRPADYEAVRERLAPGNAAWPMALASTLDSALTVAQRKAEFKKLRDQAAAMPEFDCYDAQRRNFILESFQQPRNFPDAWLMQAHAHAPMWEMDSLISSEQKRGYEAYKAGNAAEGSAAYENSQRLMLSRLRAIVHQGGKTLMKMANYDPPAPKKGPIPEALMRYRQRQEQLGQLAGRIMLPFTVDEPAVEQSMCGCSSFSEGESYQSIAGPLKNAAWLFTIQGMLMGLVGIFITTSIVVYLRQRPWPQPASKLAQCLKPLLTPRGAVVILFHGVILPLIWTALWLPHFRANKVADYGLAVTLAPGLLCVVALTHAASREVWRRTRVAGLGRGWSPRLLRALPLLSAYAVIPAGCFPDFTGEVGLWVFLGLPALWLLVKSVTGFYFFWNGQARQALIARAMLPPLLIATACAVLPVPFLHLAEQKVAARVIEDEKKIVHDPEAIRLADQLWQDWGYAK